MEQPNDYTKYNIILWKKGGLINHYTEFFLNFDSLEEDFEYIMFLKFEKYETFKPDIPKLVESLDSIYFYYPNAFVVLTPKKEPPTDKERSDEFISSFSCNFLLFKKMIADFGNKDFYLSQLLFELLDHIFKGKSGFNQIFARQLPIQDDQIFTTGRCAVIVPHKGGNNYLDGLMFFLKQVNQIDIFIGIDQEVTEEIKELRSKYLDVSFYSFSPNPVGPYIVRNWLIEKSKNEFVCFQDSDDISCGDRFERLSDYIVKNTCQLCGSHEIKMDYYTKTVSAIRYPTNVMNALSKSGGHALLHPSSMITRAAFYLGGRLSEERIFGNDTKFLYHGYFIFNSIHNVDDFLYFRRNRPDSLTTSPETSIVSPIRRNLILNWMREFDRVKHGIIKLENTSLNYEASTLKFEVRKL